jgi:hypothetical protein
MATAFEELRARRSWLPVGAGLVLWLIALVSSWFVGVFTGLASFVVLGVPLDMFGEALGSKYLEQIAFQVGWAIPPFLALLGPPLAVVLADRLAPWVLGARPASRAAPADAPLLSSLETIGVAAGNPPILLLVDENWIDGAGFGRRDGQELVVLSSSASRLPRGQQEMLCALTLADSVGGRGAARARLAAAAPALLPLVAARKGALLLRRRPVFFMTCLFVPIGVAAFLMAVLAQDNPESTRGPMAFALAVPVFAVLLVIGVAIASGVLLAWLAVLAGFGRLLLPRRRELIDVGAISLVRHPELWAELINGASTRPLRPSLFQRAAVDWVLPVGIDAARRRFDLVVRNVPGAAHSLGYVSSSSQQLPEVRP